MIHLLERLGTSADFFFITSNKEDKQTNMINLDRRRQTKAFASWTIFSLIFLTLMMQTWKQKERWLMIHFRFFTWCGFEPETCMYWWSMNEYCTAGKHTNFAEFSSESRRACTDLWWNTSPIVLTNWITQRWKKWR